MAGFETRIEIDDRLTGPLGQMARAGGNLREPMAEISVAVLSHTLDRFNYEYGPDGVPWEVSQAALREGRPTLYDSGALFNQIDADSGDDFASVGVQATGGPARYARIHQLGGVIKPKAGKALNTPFGYRASVTIPARPYLGIEERDLTAIDTIVIEHLRRAVGGEGAAA